MKVLYMIWGMRAIRWTALGNMYGRQQEITSGFILIQYGDFIDTYADVVSVGREKIKCYLRELLSILGVKTFYDVMVDLHPLTKWF